jgi:hypothetical protein
MLRPLLSKVKFQSVSHIEGGAEVNIRRLLNAAVATEAGNGQPRDRYRDCINHTTRKGAE